MSTVDPFARTDELDDDTLEALAVRFEARGRHPVFSRMLGDYLEAMQIDAAGSVLDLGCGTGVAARRIAARPQFAGSVVGIDLSPHLVAVARRLASDDSVADRTDFKVGDAGRIDAADGTFDAVVAHTLLSHVADPRVVLDETARVLRAGGMLGVFDGDYASLAFGHPDPETARRYDDALVRSIVSGARVMRQLPRLLQAAGFELLDASAYVVAEVGTADVWASAIATYRRLMPQAGLVTQADADAWADQLQQDSAAGVFFGSCNYYAYVARRA